MNALLEDLRTYVQATTAENSLPCDVDSSRVLAKVLESMRGAIENSNATVTSGKLPAIVIHEGRLAQVFQNLLSNALKYRGSELPHVHVGADQKDGYWVFSVADNGIGVEAQFSEQIFGLFKRLHGRNVPCSGMGLALCQRIVEGYAGRVWLAESKPGHGSTFCFSIPVVPHKTPKAAADLRTRVEIDAGKRPR